MFKCSKGVLQNICLVTTFTDSTGNRQASNRHAPSGGRHTCIKEKGMNKLSARLNRFFVSQFYSRNIMQIRHAKMKCEWSGWSGLEGMTKFGATHSWFGRSSHMNCFTIVENATIMRNGPRKMNYELRGSDCIRIGLCVYEYLRLEWHTICGAGKCRRMGDQSSDPGPAGKSHRPSLPWSFPLVIRGEGFSLFAQVLPIPTLISAHGFLRAQFRPQKGCSRGHQRKIWRTG
jgi:hypothetical protein